MAAAYEATGTSTDDESFGFAITIQGPDGTSLPVSDYAYSYELVGCGTTLKLNETNGITVSVPDSLVTVDPGVTYRLRAGQYRHGFLAKHKTSGKVVQLFDGSWTVTEGNFNG